MHAAIAEKGPDLKEVIERLLQQTLALTGAKYGVCMLWNDLTKALHSIARWPARDGYPIEPQTIGEGILGLAAKSGKSILVEDFNDQNKSMFVEGVGELWPAKIYKQVHADTRCAIAVPLVDEGRLLGVLSIEHPEPRALTQDDRVFLESLALPAIIAFHTVDLYKRLERRIRHLSGLNLIAARVQENPYDLDTILRLYLTGITAGAGLGFGRAMLFLADQEGLLRGEAAIGAVTQQQAQAVWNRFGQKEPFLTVDLDSLLQEAERFSDEIREGKVGEYSPLGSAIRQLSLPIDQTVGAAAECLLHGRTVRLDTTRPIRSGKCWDY